MNFVECVTFLNCCHRKQCDNDSGGIMAKGEIKKVFMVIVPPPKKVYIKYCMSRSADHVEWKVADLNADERNVETELAKKQNMTQT